ncbi:hypothetical protein JI735_32925 [Paenibacillus sonchi]|uniref:Uncharacterized protein n=1 Tax=Paenibacillus sonchi TaxID=373687 RepID=A0A974PD85_9BACL|nr:hypothetical protein [Paenibacillus sonchi]QQZ61132.1 hypothetical protein JI735_32925 [Paenibacillus sonchi]
MISREVKIDEHNLLANLTSHSRDNNIDFIPHFKRSKKVKKVSPDELAIPSSELSDKELKKRIQASASACFGNLNAHQSIEVLLNLDCKTLYDEWLHRFQVRYGIIKIIELEL